MNSIQAFIPRLKWETAARGTEWILGYGLSAYILGHWFFLCSFLITAVIYVQRSWNRFHNFSEQSHFQSWCDKNQREFQIAAAAAATVTHNKCDHTTNRLADSRTSRNFHLFSREEIVSFLFHREVITWSRGKMEAGFPFGSNASCCFAFVGVFL